VHLLVSLHLVALGDRLSCRILVTLGGFHHLDGLAAEELWQELVIVLSHLLVIVRGSCAFPAKR
jgi:hypothetical protein